MFLFQTNAVLDLIVSQYELDLEVLLPLCLAVRGKIVPNDSAPGKHQFLIESSRGLFWNENK